MTPVGFESKASSARSALLWMVAIAWLGASPVPAAPPDARSDVDPPAVSEDNARRQEMLVLPQGELFDPLLADPQWPRFSAEYQWRLQSDEFERVGAVSFGESFSLVRSREYAWGEWEVGLHANMDAIFDMTEPGLDLSNEDYLFGLTGAIRTSKMTMQLRVYHVSSHVGDEYLIANGGGREDISFEAIDLLVSHEPLTWMRVYAGGGVYLDPSPAYDPITTQFGLEVTSPRSFVSGHLTPIAAIDLQLRQQNDWTPDLAILSGLRFAQPGNDVRRIELVARYYNGRSPEGQFFRHKIESLGLGLRLGF